MRLIPKSASLGRVQSDGRTAIAPRTASIKTTVRSRVTGILIAFVGAVLGSRSASAQFRLNPPRASLESLLASPGPKWHELRSPHFTVYSEEGVQFSLSPRMLLDSLEDAWSHDTALLRASGIETSPVTVLVTHSPARFPNVLAPSSRGVMRRDDIAGDIIILVHNDSTRAFSRHEVMHVVSWRLWGPPGAPWVDEGLATFADGSCQNTSVRAVARDLLHAEPGFTASDLEARYKTSAGPVLGRRLRAYVLAASMVDFMYSRGGPEAIRVLRRDGIPARKTILPADSLTAEWRNYVERSAAGEPGLPSEALDAHGCG